MASLFFSFYLTRESTSGAPSLSPTTSSADLSAYIDPLLPTAAIPTSDVSPSGSAQADDWMYGMPVSLNVLSSMTGLLTGSNRLCGSSSPFLFAIFEPVCLALGQ